MFFKSSILPIENETDTRIMNGLRTYASANQQQNNNQSQNNNQALNQRIYIIKGPDMKR